MNASQPAASFVSVLGLLVLLLAADSALGARRSLRVDSGGAWGEQQGCDAAQFAGNLLKWRGYTFSGYAPMVVQQRYCQYASGLVAGDLNQDPDLQSLFKPGETIAAARYGMLSGTNPFFLDDGEQAFQWAFYYFADAIIVGLYGPRAGDADLFQVDLAVDASTTYLKYGDAPALWTGAGYAGEYLCFGTDGSFRGAFSSANVASCRGDATQASPLPLLVALPDLNTNGVPDMALLRGTGPFVAEIRDGLAGAAVATIPFLNAGYSPVAARLLPDSDNNGIDELALLARRGSDGAGVVQIRNLAGPALTRSVVFSSGFSPVDLALVDAADNNGVVGLAVLLIRDSNRRGFVETRNAIGAVNRTLMALDVGTTPARIAVAGDADGDAVPEFAVLASRNVDGRALVQRGNIGDAVVSASIFYRSGRRAVDFAVIDDADGNGIPEAAVLLSNNSSLRTVVDVKNLAGPPQTVSVPFSAGHEAMALRRVPDANADAVDEIAVLSRRDSDDFSLVEVVNVSGRGGRNAVLVQNSFVPLGLGVLDEISANGVAEIALVSKRRSTGRFVVLVRNARGDQQPLTYWFDP